MCGCVDCVDVASTVLMVMPVYSKEIVYTSSISKGHPVEVCADKIVGCVDCDDVASTVLMVMPIYCTEIVYAKCISKGHP